MRLAASQFTGSDDVVFGETLTGRDIPLSGVEGVLGPLVATVPVRIRIDRASSVATYLQTVQQGSLARTPYQHMGMQNIRKASNDAQYACGSRHRIGDTTRAGAPGKRAGVRCGGCRARSPSFQPIPAHVGLSGSRRTEVSGCVQTSIAPSSVVAQMKRMLAQLGETCARLMKESPRGSKRSLASRSRN